MAKKLLSPETLAELPTRLHNAADAFYIAGMLTSAPFDAAHVLSKKYLNAREAGISALNGPNPINYLGAPPIVCFGFAIELYLKLLQYMINGEIAHGHDLLELFYGLEKASPNVADKIVENHFYSAGCKKEFICYLKDNRSVFEDWRYAHEKDLLVSSADTLFSIADAIRSTICEIYPILSSNSVFQSSK